MWRKLILILAAALLVFVAVQVIAQTTTTSSVSLEYSLLFRPPTDPRPVKFATPTFRWTNTRGATLALDADSGATVSVPMAARGRSVTAVLADSSMMARRFGTTQKLWTITVTDTTRRDSETGTVSLRISDVGRGTAKDTSIFVSANGLYCPDLVMDSVDVIFAPYDSIRAGDRALLAWITTQWW